MKIARAFILICLIVAPSWSSEEGKATLVRKYGKNSAAFADMSQDGRFILTIGKGKIGNCKNCPILAVYETRNGKKVGEFAANAMDYFYAAAFRDSRHVIAMKWHKLWQEDSSISKLEWDFIAGTQIERPLQNIEGFSPRCFLDESQMIGVLWNANNKPPDQSLALSTSAGLRLLGLPSKETPLPYPRMSDRLHYNCSAWVSDGKYLFGKTNPEPAVCWASIKDDSDLAQCHSFPEQTIHGYAASPDGSLIAVVTSIGDLKAKRNNPPPSVEVMLTVLRSEDFKIMSKFVLPFPDVKPVWRAPLLAPKNKYLDNRFFSDQLASSIAISPDNSKLAFAYGIYRDPDGIAYWGLFSLTDGRRIATLRGDVYRGGLWQGLISDQLWAPMAPINGAMRFSPDSRTLFATSKCVWQWDLSGL